jgi:hypothetical protein
MAENAWTWVLKYRQGGKNFIELVAEKGRRKRMRGLE